MKRLILLRHAKAVAKDAVRDVERVLAPRGWAQMEIVAPHLASMPFNLALVSPSARTRETWTLARRPDVPTRFDQSIYEASETELLEVARGADEGAAAVVLVGHNPAFEQLAHDLVGTGPEAAMDRMRTGYPTAGVATIEFEIDAWSALAPGTGHLVSFETPRSLGFDGDD